MTLPASGQISIGQIATEFGLGYTLSTYYGVKWYKDDNSRGYFQSGGNKPPFSLTEFYSKRGSIPVVASGPSNQPNGNYIVPFYNKITIIIKGGDGGSAGPPGANGETGYPTAGSDGAAGNGTSFGSYYSVGGGAKNSGAAPSATIIFNAENNTVTINSITQSYSPPLKGVAIACSSGAGGAGGRGGYNRVYRDFPPPFDYLDGYYDEDNTNFGADGANGYVSIKVE